MNRSLLFAARLAGWTAVSRSLPHGMSQMRRAVPCGRLLCRSLCTSTDPSESPSDFHLMRIESPDSLPEVNLTDIREKPTVPPLLRQIFHSNPDEVLSLVEQHLEHLTKEEVAACLGRLAKRHKASLTHDARFQMLCALAAKRSPFMHSTTCLDALWCMQILGMDSNAPAVRILLQLMRHHINDLDLTDLLKLMNVLSRMTPSSQIQVLLAGAGVLLKVNWDVEDEDVFLFRMRDLRGQTVPSLACLLRLFGSDLSERFHEWVLGAMLGTLRRTFHMRLDHVPTHWAVLALGAVADSKARHPRLEQTCVAVLSAKAQHIRPEHLDTVLTSLTKLHIYTPDFLDELGDLWAERADPEHGLLVLHHMTVQGHHHRSLLEMASSIQASHLHQLDTPTLLKAHVSFSAACCSVPNVLHETLNEHLSDMGGGLKLTPESALDTSLSYTTIRRATPQCILDQISQHFFEGAFESPLNLRNKLHLIDKYSSSSLSSRLIIDAPVNQEEGVDEVIRQIKWEFRGLLHKVFDMALIECDMLSPSGLFVDNAVYFGPASQYGFQGRLAFLLMPDSDFFRNTGRLKGLQHLFAEELQNDGYSIAIVKTSTWASLPHHERISYLKNKVITADDCQDLNFAAIR